MVTDAGVEHSGLMLVSVPYIWIELRHVLEGVNAHLCKQEFGEVSRTAEAAESFICIRNTDCSLRLLRFTLRNKGARC